MKRHFAVWVAVVIAATIVGVTGLDAQLASFYVEWAKERGSTNLVISEGSGDHEKPTADQLLRQGSLVILMSVGTSPIAQRVIESGVLSWYTFRIEQTLTPKRENRWACGGPPPEIPPLRSGDIALQFFGGTTVVEGVSITFKDHWGFVPIDGGRYLAIVTHCSNTTGIAGSPYAWFNLASNGSLTQDRISVEQSEILKLGSLNRVREWLAQKRR